MVHGHALHAGPPHQFVHLLVLVLHVMVRPQVPSHGLPAPEIARGAESRLVDRLDVPRGAIVVAQMDLGRARAPGAPDEVLGQRGKDDAGAVPGRAVGAHLRTQLADSFEPLLVERDVGDLRDHIHPLDKLDDGELGARTLQLDPDHGAGRGIVVLDELEHLFQQGHRHPAQFFSGTLERPALEFESPRLFRRQVQYGTWNAENSLEAAGRIVRSFAVKDDEAPAFYTEHVELDAVHAVIQRPLEGLHRIFWFFVWGTTVPTRFWLFMVEKSAILCSDVLDAENGSELVFTPSRQVAVDRQRRPRHGARRVQEVQRGQGDAKGEDDPENAAVPRGHGRSPGGHVSGIGREETTLARVYLNC